MVLGLLHSSEKVNFSGVGYLAKPQTWRICYAIHCVLLMNSLKDNTKMLPSSIGYIIVNWIQMAKKRPK
jgi:hypothetical protein